jgi:acyl-CoA synthetase (NDP forming)
VKLPYYGIWKDLIVNSADRLDGLKPFFEAKRVAVIGASRTPGKGGYNIVENLLKLGYSGDIYPINPRARQLLGLKVYSTLQDTPETPDLAMIVLPPEQVMASLNECADLGIRAVIVESAGFGEMDAGGAKVQERMVELARQTGMRIMGPNSVGTVNTLTGFDASLGRLHKLFLPEADIVSGQIGFVCQTGLITGVYLPLINTELGISKAACLGNKCDVDESDMLEYMAADPQTKIIAMYLESIKNGRRFMEISRRVVREKPVMVFKSGPGHRRHIPALSPVRTGSTTPRSDRLVSYGCKVSNSSGTLFGLSCTHRCRPGTGWLSSTWPGRAASRLSMPVSGTAWKSQNYHR